MEQVVLRASRREDTGKEAARRLRREGLVPCVAYGRGRDAVSLAVSREDVEHALAGHHGGAVLFSLQVEGSTETGGTAALVKAIQRHPVSRDPESIDFQWVSLTEKVTVSVRVVLGGEIPDELGTAVVDQLAYEVPVSCLPLEIPDQVTMSIEGIQLHETRTAAMLQVPPGVEVLLEPDAPIVTCTLPSRAEEEPREGEAVEGEIETVEEAEGGAEAPAPETEAEG